MRHKQLNICYDFRRGFRKSDEEEPKVTSVKWLCDLSQSNTLQQRSAVHGLSGIVDDSRLAVARSNGYSTFLGLPGCRSLSAVLHSTAENPKGALIISPRCSFDAGPWSKGNSWALQVEMEAAGLKPVQSSALGS